MENNKHKKAINLHKLADIAGVDYQRANKALYYSRPDKLTSEEKAKLIKAIGAVHDAFLKSLEG